MTENELKSLFESNGYSIHKKMDDITLKRRNEIYIPIDAYIRHKEYEYKCKTGKYAYIYCINLYAQQRIRNRMKEIHGNLNYNEIDDLEWPKVKEMLISVGKQYIDKRFNKL